MNTTIPTRIAIWLLVPAFLGAVLALIALAAIAPAYALLVAAAASVPLWAWYIRAGRR